MDIAGKQRCIYCMHPMTENGICEKCNKSEKDYKLLVGALEPGTCLRERYFIGSTKGVGGYGITYIAWDVVLAIPVAIKEYVAKGESVEDFLNEARRMSRVSINGGIVSVKDYFQENNTAYIVMDYVEGESAKQYVKDRGKMEPAKVLEVMKPVVDALCAMHEVDLLHRDISADNIMLTESLNAFLIDFGTARENMNADQTMTVAIKRGYSPEEQYRSKGEHGTWSDVYSMCVTLYYMITAIMPDESVERVLSDKVVPLAKMDDIDLPLDIKKAIDKGMSIFSKDRYKDAIELYNALYKRREKVDFSDKNIENKKDESDDFSKTEVRRRIESALEKNSKGNKKKIIVVIIVVMLIGLMMYFVINNKNDKAGDNSIKVTNPPGNNFTGEVTATPATSTAKPTKKPRASAKPTAKPTKKPRPSAKPTAKPTKKPRVSAKPTARPKKKSSVSKKSKNKNRDKTVVLDDFL